MKPLEARDTDEGPMGENLADIIPVNGHNTLISGKVNFYVCGFD
jgi:hypothetical protein